MTSRFYRNAAAFLVLAALAKAGSAAEYMQENDFQKKFAFSPAVITQGGRVVWLAGTTVLRDAAGKDISGQFEPQVRAIFAAMNEQLKKAGGSLANLVTMTVYVRDAANVRRFAQIRKTMFADGSYPASTFIAGSSFALPGIEIEIQGTAVVGDECSSTSSCGLR